MQNERYADMLAESAEQVKLKTLGTVKHIGAFDCAMISGKQLVCVAVVVDAKTMDVVERKELVKEVPAPYVPGYSAFRFGPLILENYYSLEHEPEVLMVDGEGIAHPDGGGIATFVGVELARPIIGISKQHIGCDIEGDDILIAGKNVGKVVKTREHSNPLYVSPGNLITIEDAARIVKTSVRYPHKLPEPLHIAHRIAARTAQKLRDGSGMQQQEQDNDIVAEATEA